MSARFRYPLFDLDTTPNNAPLAEAADRAYRAVRLTSLVVAGLMKDAEDNVVDFSDLELLHECVDAADLLARDVVTKSGKGEAAGDGPPKEA